MGTFDTNGDLLTPCDLQRKAGKASSKNWKTTIRYQDQPISKFLVSYRDEMGRRRCRFEPNATLQASLRASLDPQSSILREESPSSVAQVDEEEEPNAPCLTSNNSNDILMNNSGPT